MATDNHTDDVNRESADARTALNLGLLAIENAAHAIDLHADTDTPDVISGIARLIGNEARQLWLSLENAIYSTEQAKRDECIRLSAERVVAAYRDLVAEPGALSNPEGLGMAKLGDLFLKCRMLAGWLDEDQREPEHEV